MLLCLSTCIQFRRNGKRQRRNMGTELRSNGEANANELLMRKTLSENFKVVDCRKGFYAKWRVTQWQRAMKRNRRVEQIEKKTENTEALSLIWCDKAMTVIMARCLYRIAASIEQRTTTWPRPTSQFTTEATSLFLAS